MFSLIPWKKKGHELGSVSAEPVEHQLTRLRDEFDNLVSRFWGEWPSLGGDWFSRGWATDYDENDREYVVRVETPGFEAGDFDVQVSGNQLVIRAEHKVEQQGESGSSYHHGTLYRSVPLPLGVEPDKIEARCQNGILELHLPKNEKSRGKRIAVKTG